MTGSDGFFTYEKKSGNNLQYLTAIRFNSTNGDSSPLFNTGSVVSQYLDVSNIVKKWKRKAVLGEGEFYWTAEFEGVDWTSNWLNQDASVLLIVTHWDDIVGDHAPQILFRGWLDQPKVTSNTERGTWTCTAQGMRKYLKLLANKPGDYGGDFLQGTITASPPLIDLSAEPTETIYTTDCSIQNVLDELDGTIYASLDVPGVSQLTAASHGAIENAPIIFGPTPISGQGLKLTTIYANPAENGKYTRQQTQFLCVYNNTQTEPPNVFPWENDSGTPDLSPTLPDGNPNPAFRSAGAATKNAATEWGLIDITKYQIEYGGGRSADQTAGRRKRIYLGAKNGGPVPPIILPPQTGAIICYDEHIFRGAWGIPEGWAVIEIKNCDGFQIAQDPVRNYRGAGYGAILDPDGDWVALRAGPKWQEDRRYSAIVAGDNGTSDTLTLSDVSYTEPGSDTGVLITTSLDAWPSEGFVKSDTSNKLIWYSTKDSGAGTLSGLTRVRAGAISAGDRIVLYQDLAHWYDFVAWGDILAKIPWDFPAGGAGVGLAGTNSEDTRNQNRSGFIGEWVWSVWTNGADYVPIVGNIAYDTGNQVSRRPGPHSANDWASVTDSAKVCPAIPVGQALRRNVVMGGGVFREFAGASSYDGHDSNSPSDWGLMQGVRIGNADVISQSLFVKYEVAEHSGAGVLADDTETLSTDGVTPLGIITVGTNEARNYPMSMDYSNPAHAVCFMRALLPGGGVVDFVYKSRGNSTFNGVRKLDGTLPGTVRSVGVTIPAATPAVRLTTVINTKANWNFGGPTAFVQRNMPICTGVSIRRSGNLADTAVTGIGAATVTVAAGQAAGFLSSGTIKLYEASGAGSAQGGSSYDPWSPGLSVTDATLSSGGVRRAYRVTYTGRTDSQFTGCVFPSNEPPYTATASTRAVQDASTINYPAEMDILFSREDEPSDPLTFLDNNPSWDKAYTMSGGNQRTDASVPDGIIDRFFPCDGAAGTNPFVHWIYVKVSKTTDGRRLFLNTMRFHRYPTRPMSSEFDPANTEVWHMTYTTSSLIHDILVDAGIDFRLINLGAGENLRKFTASFGNIWETCRQLAIMGNGLFGETCDGAFLTVRDPRTSGAPYRSQPKVDFTPEAIWGFVDTEAYPRNMVSQIQYDAVNPASEEQFLIYAPPNPVPLGTIRSVSGKIHPNEQAAEAAARMAFRRANDGHKFKIPGGLFTTELEPADIVRGLFSIDLAGKLFAGDLLVTGIEDDGNCENSSMLSSISADEMVVP